jgi:D-alanine-D-alanine ligase
LKIAVFFGGDSMERDVSVASANQVVAALRSRGHEVVAVDAERGPLTGAAETETLSRAIDRKPPPKTAGSGLPVVTAGLVDQGFDVVFLAVHGGSGEDGTLQALLDVHGLRYTGSGRLGSAVAWDKAVSKALFVAADVPTPEWLLAPADADEVGRKLGFPVIVKPSGQGSTVGLSLVEDKRSLADAVALAARFDGAVLIERFVAGRELTVGVLGGEALSVGEIIPAQGAIFDYEAKYQPGGAQEIFPADVPEALAGRVRELGLAAHAALRLEDYSRVDFRLDPAGGLWCLEANTLPGLSPGSLLPQSAAAAGIDFGELCERICLAALDKH